MYCKSPIQLLYESVTAIFVFKFYSKNIIRSFKIIANLHKHKSYLANLQKQFEK